MSKKTPIPSTDKPRAKKVKLSKEEDEDEKDDPRIAKYMKEFEKVVTPDVFSKEINLAASYEEGVIQSRAYKEGLRPALQALMDHITPKRICKSNQFIMELRCYMESDDYSLKRVVMPEDIADCFVLCGCCGMSVKAAEWWRTDSTEFDTELYAFDRECLVKIKNIVMVYNALRVLSGKAVLHPVCRPFVDKELESVESRRVLLKSLLHVALMQAF